MTQYELNGELNVFFTNQVWKFNIKCLVIYDSPGDIIIKL